MKHRTHVMDEAFTLILFAVFAGCAMLLILLGAGVYTRVSAGMDEMDAPMILSYVTEKLRGCDGWEDISLGENGELLLTETVSGESYVTWIYLEDGYLKETLMQEGSIPVEGAGTCIASVSEFEVEILKERLLKIQVKDAAGVDQQRYFAGGTAPGTDD